MGHSGQEEWCVVVTSRVTPVFTAAVDTRKVNIVHLDYAHKESQFVVVVVVSVAQQKRPSTIKEKFIKY